MVGGVFPGGVHIGLRKARVSSQEPSIVLAEAPVADQYPYRNSAIAHTGITAATVGLLGNPTGSRGHQEAPERSPFTLPNGDGASNSTAGHVATSRPPSRS